MSAALSIPEPFSPLLAPIPGDAPGGADVTYDPEFARLVEEIDKLTSLAGELPDWGFVIQECERTLREKSKDLRVMGWLVAARAHAGGFPGIAEGLTLYAALTKAWWPSLFPPVNRLRARAGQVEWLWRTLAKRVAALPVTAGDAPIVRSLEPLVAELGAFFSEALKDSDPTIAALRIAVREKVRQLPAEEPPPPPATPTATPTNDAPAGPSAPSAPIERMATPAPVTPAAPVAPAAPAPPPPELAEIVIDPSSMKGLDETQDAARPLRVPLTTLAHHARRVAPTSPWPYRVLRVAAWLTIEAVPEAENGKTFVRGPKPQERDQLASLLAAGHWDGLLHSAEEAVGEHPFWLDLHRYVALALDNKGADHRGARQAVGRETSAFLQRLSGIQRLLFSNGTPFASQETIEWLDGERARFGAAQGRAGASSSGSAADSPALAEVLAALGGDEGGDDALATAIAGAERLPSARERFRGLLAVAHTAQRGARADLAVAIYERLLPEVDATLERWEPALAAELLHGLLKARRAPQVAPRARDVGPDDTSLFRRLLTLDPHAALRLRA